MPFSHSYVPCELHWFGHSLTMGEAASVFAEQLAKYKYGHALWWPEPTNGPLGHEHEVEIGDVGYIDEDGAFQLLFNVTYDANHELMPYNKASIETKEKFCRTGPLYILGQVSACVAPFLLFLTVHKKNRDSPVPTQAARYPIDFNVAGRKFERYMRQHHWNWVEYATDPDHLGIQCQPEDIILVRDAVKTSSWTVGAFIGEGSRVHEIALEGQLGPIINVGLHYSSQEACGSLHVAPRSGPSHRVLSHIATPVSSPHIAPLNPIVVQEPPPKDQCVFLSYYKMKYRRLLPSKIMAAADVVDDSEPDGSGGMVAVNYQSLPPI
ncbi:hypothetical protein BC629DRAFT_1512516 [Irpex lacteus]|nr:hypothetical protein BC629DRAFT_1512516 [Irpex lacteus]